jgi:putative membrane protein
MTSVATNGSLNDSIGDAQKHYRSLFFLPSVKMALVGVAVVSVITGLSAELFTPGFGGLLRGLALGISLLAVNLLADLFLSRVLLKDPIFVLRRTLVLSLFGWVFWFLFIVLGIALGAAFGFMWWVRLCLLGFATLITLRAVVFFSTLSASLMKRLIAVLIQPLFCIVPLSFYWAERGIEIISLLPFIVVSPVIAVLSAYFFVSILNRIGEKKYGVPSMEIFKAFMLNWVAALNGPLEHFFEKMGEDIDVEVSLLKFDSSRPKAALILPLVHPGPFKNIGSSILPSLLKEAYEKKYHCDACVPLGLLGHELDAASQVQNQLIIGKIVDAAAFNATVEKATPFVRVTEGFASASCQLFGKSALLSFTLAPKTTEDLPLELGRAVREEAAKLGLESAVVVNSHNSITGNTQIEATLDELQDVASKSMRKALSMDSYPFKVGSSTTHPPEFSLKEGMGAGGITAVVIEIQEQKAAYVVIDGNNMVSGLREKILSSLAEAGFQGGEVFTTDTHAVSAVVVGRRGYHPVGEKIDQDLLVDCIKETVLMASNKLERCRAGCLQFTVPSVRVIGGECLNLLAFLVDKTIQKAKRIIGPVFALEGLFLVLLLLFA